MRYFLIFNRALVFRKVSRLLVIFFSAKTDQSTLWVKMTQNVDAVVKWKWVKKQLMNRSNEMAIKGQSQRWPLKKFSHLIHKFGVERELFRRCLVTTRRAFSANTQYSCYSISSMTNICKRRRFTSVCNKAWEWIFHFEFTLVNEPKLFNLRWANFVAFICLPIKYESIQLCSYLFRSFVGWTIVEEKLWTTC